MSEPKQELPSSIGADNEKCLRSMSFEGINSLSFGRCERIRTFDPLHPMQVRYQAAPHTDLAFNYNPAQGHS